MLKIRGLSRVRDMGTAEDQPLRMVFPGPDAHLLPLFTPALRRSVFLEQPLVCAQISGVRWGQGRGLMAGRRQKLSRICWEADPPHPSGDLSFALLVACHPDILGHCEAENSWELTGQGGHELGMGPSRWLAWCSPTCVCQTFWAVLRWSLAQCLCHLGSGSG